VGVVLNAPFPRRRRLANVVRNGFRYLFLGALRSWTRNLGANTPALGSMTLLLMLSGLVGLSAFVLQDLAAIQSRDAAVLHVYLRDDAKPEDVAALRARLAGDGRVAAISYTSKADALNRAQHRSGLPDLAGASDSNPFPASLDVRLRDVRDVGDLAASVGNSAAVDPILTTSYDRGSYQRIQRVLLVLAVAGAGFLLLLAFVAVAVTGNSIRAAIYARQHELSIMQLVGASRWMVRAPFVVEGAMTGAIAGAIAAVVTLAISLAALVLGASSFGQLAPGITVGACLLTALLVFLAGLGLGSGASFVSVQRQLRA
jgi:cell division transport system permease protein